MSGPGSPDPSQDDFAQRLERLRQQVERKDRSTSSDRSRAGSTGNVSPMGQAMRLSSEFIGGVVVGGALGWGFDWLLGTKPWGLIVFLGLGFVTGIYNVMRISGFSGTAAGQAKPKNGPEGP